MPNNRILKHGLQYSKPLGFLLYAIGVVGFLVLSQPEYNYQTYVSENALLIGLVDESYKPGREIFDAMKELTENLKDKSRITSFIRRKMDEVGIEVYEQEFTFSHKLLEGVGNVSSSNLYGIMRSRSGSRTEALLIIAPLRATGESGNVVPGSYAYLISLANQLTTQLYWAKDIIFLFPDMEYIGLVAWLDAYYGVKTSSIIRGAKLKGRSGSLQAGISLEFSSLDMIQLDVSFQGINGELPNLDLINIVTRLATKHSIPLSFHGKPQGYGYSSPLSKLQQLISSIWVHGSGSPSGLHGPLINFQVPCLTLRGIPGHISVKQPNVNHIHQIGSLIEGFLRCLNNLQERLHQSFYCYILPDLWRYISIGVYSPFFFTALAGLLLQVVGIGFEFPATEEKSCAISVDIPELTKSDSTPPTTEASHLDTHVRRRTNIVKTTTKTKGSTQIARERECEIEEKAKNGWNQFGYRVTDIQLTATALTLSVAVCVVIREFPNVLYNRLLTLLIDKPDEVWQLNENVFFATFLAAVALPAFLLPLIAVATRSRWLGYGQNWRLTCSLSAFLWACFLGCLSLLNVSAAFIILGAVEPVLLCVVCRSRPTKLHRILLMLLLVSISPPALVMAATLVDSHVPQYPPSGVPATSSFLELQQRCGKVLFQVHMEAATLGSWSWSLLTLGVTPLWLFLWNGVLLSGT